MFLFLGNIYTPPESKSTVSEIDTEEVRRDSSGSTKVYKAKTRRSSIFNNIF